MNEKAVILNKSNPSLLPPGPKFLESIRYVLSMQKARIDGVENLFHRYGDFVHIHMYYHFFLISHPESIERVLKGNSKGYGKSWAYDELRPLLGNGLLTSEGEQWKQQRRTLAPEFTPSHFLPFTSKMVELTDSLLDEWQESKRTGKSRDISVDFMRLTLNIATHCFFGAESGPFSKAIGEGMEAASQAGIQKIYSMLRLPMWVPTPLNRRYQKAITQIEQALEGLMQGGDFHETSFLARLKGKVDPKEFRDQMMTFLLAGHETTSNALSWAFFQLSSEPEITAQMEDEIERVLAGAPPTAENVQKLTFVKKVLLECMRLYPPVPLLSRTALEDDKLKGYTIPKGSMVDCLTYTTHRHPDYWPDPMRFDPHRFDADKIKARSDFAYFPFGGGPRVCIGEAFALHEMLVLTARILQRFRPKVVAPEKVEAQAHITLRPHPGIEVTL